MMACRLSHRPFSLLSFVVVAFLVVNGVDGYSVGDYVPMARRGQFNNLRTNWHDAIGRHCPRFAVNKETVLPIPRPTGFEPGQHTYKISLSMGKERFVTPWLLIISRSGRLPLLDVTLTHFAGDLRGVKASVEQLPDSYLQRHRDVVREFRNLTHWPKHIIVRYSWKEIAEVDVTTGLFVLFGTTFALTTFLAIFILQSSKDKLARFVNEQMMESAASAGLPASEVAKVE